MHTIVYTGVRVVGVAEGEDRFPLPQRQWLNPPSPSSSSLATLSYTFTLAPYTFKKGFSSSNRSIDTHPSFFLFIPEMRIWSRRPLIIS